MRSTQAGGDGVKCSVVWTPHSFPDRSGSLALPQPLPLIPPFTLLRLCCDGVQPSLTERTVLPSFTPVAVAALVASWPCRTILGEPLQDLPLSPFPLMCAPLKKILRTGMDTNAAYSATPCPSSGKPNWTMLEILQSDVSTNSNNAAQANAIEMQAASAAVRSSGASQGSSALLRRRIRLSVPLRAVTWKSLFTRQNRRTDEEGTAPLAMDVNRASVETAIADREALAMLFPALHHGVYFATPQAFEDHCLLSDEHLVWCEDASLVTVEWDSVKDGEKTAVQRTSTSMSSTSIRNGMGRLDTTRKRRRQWLLQPEHSTNTWKESEPKQRRIRLPSLAGTCDDAAASTDANVTHLADNMRAPINLPNVCCAYALNSVTVREESQTVAAAGQSPFLCSAIINAKVDRESFAAWYSMLRSACRMGLIRWKDAVYSAAADATDGVCEAAVEEVLLHGVTCSLAMWCSADAAQEASTSPVRNVQVVASLLHDWWHQLAREASLCTSLGMLKRQDDKRCPASSRVAVAAELRNALFTKCYVLEDINEERAVSPRVSGSVPDAGSPDVASAHKRASRWPSLLGHLSVACAAVLTREKRQKDRLWWWPWQRSPSPDRQRITERHPTKLDGRGASKRWSETGDLLRTSPQKEQKIWEDYRACMDLTLHLFIAEQQVLVSKCFMT